MIKSEHVLHKYDTCIDPHAIRNRKCEYDCRIYHNAYEQCEFVIKGGQYHNVGATNFRFDTLSNNNWPFEHYISLFIF